MKSDSDIRDLSFEDRWDFPAPLPSDPRERVRLVDEWRFRFAKFFYELGAEDALTGVPCSERLPEIRHRVMFKHNGEWSFGRRDQKRWIDDAGNVHFYGDVTHWSECPP